MVMNFGRTQTRDYSPLIIGRAPVERVSSFKYLGVQLTKDLS